MALMLLHLCLFDGVPKETPLYFRRVVLGELSTEAELWKSVLRGSLLGLWFPFAVRPMAYL
jgi:hypothetical protein